MDFQPTKKTVFGALIRSMNNPTAKSRRLKKDMHLALQQDQNLSSQTKGLIKVCLSEKGKDLPWLHNMLRAILAADYRENIPEFTLQRVAI